MIDAAITSVSPIVYTVPTDAPEADGTLAWDATTMVLVEVRVTSWAPTWSSSSTRTAATAVSRRSG